MALTSKNAKIKLGDNVRDTYTGFSGHVHAIANYITGCDQVLVNPRTIDKDGKPHDGVWFDIVRIELVKPEKALKKVTTGGPTPSELSRLSRA